MSDPTIPLGSEPTAPSTPNGADAHRVVTSVVETVQNHPDIPPGRAALVITDILAGLYQAQPAIFAVSRASARTQAELSLGLGLAQILVSALLRRPS